MKIDLTTDRLASIILNHLHPNHNVRLMVPHATVTIDLENHDLSVWVPDDIFEIAAPTLVDDPPF